MRSVKCGLGACSYSFGYTNNAFVHIVHSSNMVHSHVRQRTYRKLFFIHTHAEKSNSGHKRRNCAKLEAEAHGVLKACQKQVTVCSVLSFRHDLRKNNVSYLTLFFDRKEQDRGNDKDTKTARCSARPA